MTYRTAHQMVQHSRRLHDLLHMLSLCTTLCNAALCRK